jgi:hypothetical protein
MSASSPEAQARSIIDKQLQQAGWMVQDRAEFNPAAGTGIAVREFPLRTGFADYLLLVDRKAVGAVEAKKVGTPLSGVEAQSAKYSEGLPEIPPAWRKPLPFLYESTGMETFLRMDSIPIRAVVASSTFTARRRCANGSPLGRACAPASCTSATLPVPQSMTLPTLLSCIWPWNSAAVPVTRTTCLRLTLSLLPLKTKIPLDVAGASKSRARQARGLRSRPQPPAVW